MSASGIAAIAPTGFVPLGLSSRLSNEREVRLVPHLAQNEKSVLLIIASNLPSQKAQTSRMLLQADARRAGFMPDSFLALLELLSAKSLVEQVEHTDESGGYYASIGITYTGWLALQEITDFPAAPQAHTVAK